MDLIGNFVINYAVYLHKFSPPGGERCDVAGQFFGDRCTDHIYTSVYGLEHRLILAGSTGFRFGNGWGISLCCDKFSVKRVKFCLFFFQLEFI